MGKKSDSDCHWLGLKRATMKDMTGTNNVDAIRKDL